MACKSAIIRETYVCITLLNVEFVIIRKPIKRSYALLRPTIQVDNIQRVKAVSNAIVAIRNGSRPTVVLQPSTSWSS